ncbi:MAG TPA: M24 family metallopeptidase, partial [Candidatus Binataceae bacterium]|nr:M24 family metallopeptidase [Candidatus Binataceae bacterium]
VEAHRLDALDADRIVYRSHAEMADGLSRMLGGARRIAMNYSPLGAIPSVSRVDGGTLELVRSLGVEVISAADLIQRFEAALTPAQLAGHRRAGIALRMIVAETFAEIARRATADLGATELGIQAFVIDRIAAHGLVTLTPPIVAVNAHSADPHFEPSAGGDAPIRRGDFVLLDVWAKEPGPDSIYADITWTAFVDEHVPDEHAHIFEIVARARDAAILLVHERVAAGRPVSGVEGDRAARAVIEQAGFGDAFVHRTGHSIGREVHGMGANLDSLEAPDDRMLIEGTCFSVEPGIYLPGRFGVRSEVNMTIENGRAEVTGAPPQAVIVALLARRAS